MKIAIVGAGFFGLYISLYLAKKGFDVTIFEKENEAMQRASYVNQARVHNGYHYPRSILTALRSHESFSVFVDEFRDCVQDKFEKYYAISKKLSKVNATQFESFCQKVGIKCDVAPKHIIKMFDPEMIEEVFSTEEYAFDYLKLREKMLLLTKNLGVKILYNSHIDKINYIDDYRYVLSINGLKSEKFSHVFNCTYASINEINVNSGLMPVPLIHELTEMVLLKVPDEISNLGITVMCGPFFSVMPFPSTPYHTLSHVRYTPRNEYLSFDKIINFNSRNTLDKIEATSYEYMIRDSSKYLPILKDAKYIKSLWEIKTILPSSANSDSRPILFKDNYNGWKGYYCIMGGKIDNIYDAVSNIEKILIEGVK